MEAQQESKDAIVLMEQGISQLKEIRGNTKIWVLVKSYTWNLFFFLLMEIKQTFFCFTWGGLKTV